MKVDIPMHFGEFLQFKCSTGNIVISNVLRGDIDSALHNIFSISPQLSSSNPSLRDYLLSLPHGPSCISAEMMYFRQGDSALIDDNSGSLVRRVLSLLREMTGIEKDYSYNSNSYLYFGKGLGSSTADIIASTVLFYKINSIPFYELDLRHILSISEGSSDPLYLNKMVLYNSVARSVLHIIDRMPPYIILGYDPYNNKKKVVSDDVQHPDNSSLFKDDIEFICSDNFNYTCTDEYIADLATRSFKANDLYLPHAIPSIFTELSKIPGIGITGSHSGVMTGLLITKKGLTNLSKTFNGYAASISSLPLSIYMI